MFTKLPKQVRVIITLVCYAFFCFVISCSKPRSKKNLNSELIQELERKPLTYEEAKELMAEMTDNWLLGLGLGRTTLSVGSIIAFPPIAFYYLGNGAAELLGYNTFYITDSVPNILPTNWREPTKQSYFAVIGAPGRLLSFLVGRDFRDEDFAKDRIKIFLEQRRSLNNLNSNKSNFTPQLSSGSRSTVNFHRKIILEKLR
jgi:hypothetical protein